MDWGQFEDFLSNWQSASENHHPISLSDRPTINQLSTVVWTNQLLKTDDELQGFSSHSWVVDNLFDEYQQEMYEENVSTPIYAQGDNVCQLNICVQEFAVSCLN